MCVGGIRKRNRAAATWSLQPGFQSPAAFGAGAKSRTPADYRLHGFAAAAADQPDEAQAQETEHGGLGDVGTAEGDFADRAS